MSCKVVVAQFYIHSVYRARGRLTGEYTCLRSQACVFAAHHGHGDFVCALRCGDGNVGEFLTSSAVYGYSLLTCSDYGSKSLVSTDVFATDVLSRHLEVDKCLELALRSSGSAEVSDLFWAFCRAVRSLDAHLAHIQYVLCGRRYAVDTHIVGACCRNLEVWHEVLCCRVVEFAVWCHYSHCCRVWACAISNLKCLVVVRQANEWCYG